MGKKLSTYIDELAINSDVQQATDKLLILNGGLKYSTPRDLQAKGWAFYQDGTYTSISPLSFVNTRARLENDAAGVRTYTSALPVGVSSLWDAVNDKITPENEDDCYDVRVQFTAESSVQNSYFDIELDLAGTTGVVARKTLLTPKGAGTATTYMIDYPIFTKGDFITNGGTFFIDTSVSGLTLDVYNITIFIKRDYVGS